VWFFFAYHSLLYPHPFEFTAITTTLTILGVYFGMRTNKDKTSAVARLVSLIVGLIILFLSTLILVLELSPM
jgi:hypothetical protein